MYVFVWMCIRVCMCGLSEFDLIVFYVKNRTIFVSIIQVAICFIVDSFN